MEIRKCSVVGCENLQPRKSQRDLCNMHYSRWRRTGSTDAPLPPIIHCRVDGCGAIAHKYKLCIEHYRIQQLAITEKKANWKARPKPKMIEGKRERLHPLFATWDTFVSAANRRGKWQGYEICEKWTKDFESFLADMGTRPSRHHTLIRIDETAPYSPDNCMWATAAQRHRKNMKIVSLASLQNEIIKPGIEKYLTPLALYRGTRSLGRIHRMWNFAIAMMKTECTSFFEGTILSQNEDYAQLCGPEKQISHLGLRSFFSRLRLNPRVTDNVEGLAEYAELLCPRPFDLTPTPLKSFYKNCAPWRIYEPARLRKGGGNIGPANIHVTDLCYPYVVWEKGNDANELVALVHAVVPRGLPEQIRADVCQDLIVDLLAGDLSKDALVGSPRKYVGQKLRGFKWYEQQHNQSVDTELVDVLQYDESRNRFDQFVSEELDGIETSDPFKDYVEEKLGSVFRVTRS